MMRKILLALALLLLLNGAARAQSANLKALLFSPTTTNALTLKDLNGDWRVMNTGGDNGGAGGANFMTLWLSMLGGAANPSGCYTKGDTVDVGGETFVITYRAAVKPINFMALMGGNGNGAQKPTPQKPYTPDTKLTLSLLNLKTLAAFSDIHPFDLQAEIAAHQPPPPPPATAESVVNLKQLGLALIQYTQDYDEALPPMKKYAKTQEILLPYIKDVSVFTNPITKEPYQANPVISGVSLAKIENPSETVAFYEGSPAADGTRGVCFLDGHVKRIKETDWPAIKAKNKIP